MPFQQSRLTCKCFVDPTGEVVQFYGFPFMDNTMFFKAVVNPSWGAADGEEPNLDEALDAIKRATGYKITIVSVWTDMQETDIDFMVAVANVAKGTDPSRAVRLSVEQLKTIARAAQLEGVKPRWMRAMYTLHELKEMNVPELGLDYTLPSAFTSFAIIYFLYITQ